MVALGGSLRGISAMLATLYLECMRTLLLKAGSPHVHDIPSLASSLSDAMAYIRPLCRQSRLALCLPPYMQLRTHFHLTYMDRSCRRSRMRRNRPFR